MNTENSKLFKESTDHLGRKLNSPISPQRIISLCPSITETLFHLGLEEKIVGRTRFCIHPKEKVKSAVRVGGTKEIKFDRLHSLKPDLIISEKEENTPEMVAELEKKYPVFVSDVVDFESGLKMIKDLGNLTNSNEKANQLTENIKQNWLELPRFSRSPKTIYLIWKKPYMSIGSNTYIDDILSRLGMENVTKSFSGRYPEISLEKIQEFAPEYILLSSEPYPFKEKDIDEFKKILPNSKVLLVDGEMFSWYGSRMLFAPDYFKQWVFQ